MKLERLASSTETLSREARERQRWCPSSGSRRWRASKATASAACARRSTASPSSWPSASLPDRRNSWSARRAATDQLRWSGAAVVAACCSRPAWSGGLRACCISIALDFTDHSGGYRPAAALR